MSAPNREIESWAPQMGEHALFLHLLLHEVNLKQKALDLFHKWQNYVCTGYPGGVEEATRLIRELKEFKTTILKRLQAGEWLGAVYPQFVDHILRELLYFEGKLRGERLSPAEEVSFWNRINSEHAGFASHLLDPSEVTLVDKADATSKQIRDLPASDDIASVVMAIEAGVDLTNFNIESYRGVLENKVKSIIHPTLLRHVIREGQIEKNVLGNIIGQQAEQLIAPDICRH